MMIPNRKPTAILLVEDSDEDVFFFMRALKKSEVPATVTVVNNGKAALDLVTDPEQRSEFDCVFLDLKLPLVSGFEVLEALREQDVRAELPVFVLSGSPQMQDRQRAAELGVAEYLVKPLMSDVLRKLLALQCEADGELRFVPPS